MADDDFIAGPQKEVIYENSYITTPEGYGAMLTETLRSRMEGKEYDPVRSAQVAKELTDTIKEKVKDLGYDRYKLVVQVCVGQKKGQAMRFASRCLWDTSTDNYASEFFENKTLYCVAQVRPVDPFPLCAFKHTLPQVYGLYYE